MRPIVGWHLKPWDIIINPILDTEYDGLENLDFAPAMRIAYNFNDKWALAAEEYADYGPLHDLAGASEQAHMLYGVVNHTMKFFGHRGRRWGRPHVGDRQGHDEAPGHQRSELSQSLAARPSGRVL